MVVSATLVAWFYFATVDHVDVWGFGPFISWETCDQHRLDTIPSNVEATDCQLMTVEEEAA